MTAQTPRCFTRQTPLAPTLIIREHGRSATGLLVATGFLIARMAWRPFGTKSLSLRWHFPTSILLATISTYPSRERKKVQEPNVQRALIYLVLRDSLITRRNRPANGNF